MAIDPLNSASRIKTVRETRYQISNQNVSRKGEKESFSKRDDEKRDETKKKKKKERNGIYHKRNIPRLIQIK